MSNWKGLKIPGLSEWLESLFQSSGVTGRLIELDEMAFLDGGEAYTNLIISSKISFENPDFFRVTRFLFSKGREVGEMLPTQFEISANRSGEINLIVRSRAGKTLEESKVLVSVYSNDEFTDRKNYLREFKNLKSFVKPLFASKGEVLKDSHPLLNRFEENGGRDR